MELAVFLLIILMQFGTYATQTTVFPTTDTPEETCGKAQLLYGSERRVGVGSGVLCDNDLVAGWYKLELDGKPAQIPTTCLKPDACGSDVSLRISLEGKSLPEEHQETTAWACASYIVLKKYDCCVLRTEVRILNCSSFFAYYLEKTDRCPVSYCAYDPNEMIPPEYLVKHGESDIPDPKISTTEHPVRITATIETAVTETGDSKIEPTTYITRKFFINRSPTPNDDTNYTAPITTNDDISTTLIPMKDANFTTNIPTHVNTTTHTAIDNSSISQPHDPDILEATSKNESNSVQTNSTVNTLPNDTQTAIKKNNSTEEYKDNNTVTPENTSNAFNSSSTTVTGVSNETGQMDSTFSPSSRTIHLNQTFDNSTTSIDFNQTTDKDETTVAAIHVSSPSGHADNHTSVPSLASTVTTIPLSSELSTEDQVLNVTSSDDVLSNDTITTNQTSLQTVTPDEGVATHTSITTPGLITSSTQEVSTTQSVITASGRTFLASGTTVSGKVVDGQVVLVLDQEHRRVAETEFVKQLKKVLSEMYVTFTPAQSPEKSLTRDHVKTVSQPTESNGRLEVIISLHSGNDTEEDIIPADTVIHLLDTHIHDVQKLFKRELNMTLEDYYKPGDRRLVLTSTPKQKRLDSQPLFEEHLALFLAIIIIGSLCLIIIIVALLYLRCRRRRATWDRQAELEKARLDEGNETGGVENPVTDTEIMKDEQMTEKETSLSVNGAHLTPTPVADEDNGWVVPIDEMPEGMPAQKTEDTKL